MKAAIAAVALTAAILGAPGGTANAQTAISFQIATPHLGVLIGVPGPFLAPGPIYLPPVAVHAAAPVFVAPAPMFVLPPRVIVRPRVVYPVVYPYGPGRAIKHHKHGHRETRRAIVLPVGYGAYQH